jgi:Fe-coproporphyrin III synthase
MIGISKLYCGSVEPGDVLRYERSGEQLPSHMIQFASHKKPVVVYNCTRKCNLRCVHCYSESKNIDYSGELTTDQAKALIDSIARLGSPVILFSGGEPLMREDLLELMAYARSKKLRIVISTNGTLLNDTFLEEANKIGLSYIGVSLDGLEKVNDRFRGSIGAFQRALDGIRLTRKHGIKVGLRFTINKRNADEIDGIFDLMEKEQIPRICFYHLVYSGRGALLRDEDLANDETRKVVNQIIDRTADMHKRGFPAEVLTVDNHADGPYLYMRMALEGHPEAEKALKLMLMNGGNSSGNGIACVSWDGEVYADQFSRHRSFGNVLKRPFDEIWTDLSNEIMAQLKDKYPHVTGRCRQCRFLHACGGNFRARGETADNFWGVDPACYLTDEEISGERLTLEVNE